MKLPRAEKEDSDATMGALPPMGVQVLAFLVGILVTVLGVGSLSKDWPAYRQLADLEALSETEGRILKSEVRNDTSGAEDEYYPDMLFEYSVNGNNIWGWRLSMEEKPHEREFWVKRTDKYKVDDRVSVYFDPEDPAFSMLEKRSDGVFRPVLSLTGGTAFTLFGLVLVVIPLGSWLTRLRTRPASPGKQPKK